MRVAAVATGGLRKAETGLRCRRRVIGLLVVVVYEGGMRGVEVQTARPPSPPWGVRLVCPPALAARIRCTKSLVRPATRGPKRRTGMHPHTHTHLSQRGLVEFRAFKQGEATSTLGRLFSVSAILPHPYTDRSLYDSYGYSALCPVIFIELGHNGLGSVFCWSIIDCMT